MGTIFIVMFFIKHDEFAAKSAYCTYLKIEIVPKILLNAINAIAKAPKLEVVETPKLCKRLDGFILLHISVTMAGK